MPASHFHPPNQGFCHHLQPPASFSSTEVGAGSLKIKFLTYKHFKNLRASTISAFKLFQHFDMVIPAAKNACSLDTDEPILAR